MNGEQLEIMRVIEFPKNKNIENIKYKNKKELAKRVIDMLEGYFSLVINGSEDIFEEQINTDTIVITTDKEEFVSRMSIYKSRKYHILDGK